MPCWHGGYGTVALAVNLIPAVINVCPGLLTTNDIVPVSYKSGNTGRFVCITSEDLLECGNGSGILHRRLR
jgi:hypothetical protein